MYNMDLITDVMMLVASIIGLLGSLYNYFEIPKKGWLLTACFFFANMLSDYYWTIYSLVMRAEPNVSEFIAYFGWNVGYVFLLIAVIHMQDHDLKGFFHPLILLPIPLNICQFLLYIQYGGIFNNVWQVGFSTAIACVCLRSLIYYIRNKRSDVPFPYFHLIALIFIGAEYAMWTSSCFFWFDSITNPYYMAAILSYIAMVFFAWGVKKEYEAYGIVRFEKSSKEIRFQAFLQFLVAFVLFGGCLGGYYVALRMKKALPGYTDENAYNMIAITLFVVSIIVGLLILAITYLITIRHKTAQKGLENEQRLKRSTANLLLTLVITFVLMIFAVIYNSRLFWVASVKGAYQTGSDQAENLAAELDNYLMLALSTLNVTADSVDLMIEKGATQEEIEQYILDQTERQFDNFDENFTGLYAYVRGKYMDGAGWVPPDDYDASVRDWYNEAIAAGGKTIIVSPYVDAQTNSVVITICRLLQSTNTDPSVRKENVVALDVIVSHIQEVTVNTDVGGNGYAMVTNDDGMIIAHHELGFCGENINDIYGPELMETLRHSNDEMIDITLDEEECTLFVRQVMDQWYVIIAVSNTDLFEDTYSQLSVNIIVMVTIFVLISFFYYLGYRNEQAYGRKVEEMKAVRQKQEYEAEMLRLEKKSADEANKAKSNFLADMSHEIRTPINAILGMNEMVLRESGDPNIREYAGNIRNSGRNLLQLINSILDFSKIEDGKMEIVPVRYSLSSLITYLDNSIRERANTKNLEFVINVDPALPSELFGDDARINQVILNLLTNAVKYTQEGCVTLTFKEMERSLGDVLLYVEVKDTGIGIKEEDMGKLFESFERLDVVRNRSIEGTGLGMSITSRLLDLMSSKLEVRSMYGVGSNFSFRIWQKIVDERPVGEFRIGGPEDTSDIYTESFHAPEAEILVVDDTKVNIQVVCHLLKKTKVKIDSAFSGEEAIELADKKAYDVILLDQRMPGMDGTETLQKIRALGSRLNCDNPIICLTADAIRGAKERYISQGFTDYLTKPVEGAALEKMLAEYLPREKVNFDISAEKASEDNGADFMDDPMLAELSKEGFDMKTAMKFFGNDKAFYERILRDFVSEYKDRSGKLTAFYDNKDWKNYSVVVHALKSVSKSIGALELSSLAAAMEAATKKVDENVIYTEHDHLMKKFEDTRESIKSVLNISDEPSPENASDTISPDTDADGDVMEFAPVDE